MTIPVPDDLPPELQDFGREFVGILSELDSELEIQGLSDDERRATLLMVLEALKCHTTGQTPSSEEVRFWMRFLDPNVILSEACADQ